MRFNWVYKARRLTLVGVWFLLLSSIGVQATTAELVDRVLVIVNDDVITQSEYDYRLRTIMPEIEASGKVAPPDLPKQVLDALIGDRLQAQEAARLGVKVSDAELNQALSRFASQQGLTVPQLQASLEAKGQPFELFKETVRDSLIISRFTEYYARSEVEVPDYEIDGFIVANKLNQDSTEYLVARILIEGDDARERAEQVKLEITEGLSFEDAAKKHSSAPDAENGGMMMGSRTAAQLPDVFVAQLKDMQVGAVSDVIEGANGFHILKLVNLKGDRREIIQTKVRHILIKAESKVARSQAIKRMYELRRRVQKGEALSDLARIYSDDSVSAANGGDLGWVSPGEMVPPFEAAFEKLAIGELSEPVETRFGVHMMQVEDRRQQNVTDKLIRVRADQILRRQRADREFGQWVRKLKEGAYIQHVAEPA